MEYECLIVDDEKELAESTCDYFNLFDVTSTYVVSYEECIQFFKENKARLILLDINLIDKSGFELCKELRKTIEIPILFISARNSDDDVLLGLTIGGDDYIAKPYTLSVLLAKVRVVLRRLSVVPAGQGEESVEELGQPDIYIDATAGKVYKKNIEVPMKGMEYKLLRYLFENKGKIISKDELFAHVWEDSFTGDGTLNVHIRHLREKLEDNPNQPVHIKTIWGRGYSYED